MSLSEPLCLVVREEGFEGDHSLPVGARGINPLIEALFGTGKSLDCSIISSVNTDLYVVVCGGGRDGEDEMMESKNGNKGWRKDRVEEVYMQQQGVERREEGRGEG